MRRMFCDFSDNNLANMEAHWRECSWTEQDHASLANYFHLKKGTCLVASIFYVAEVLQLKLTEQNIIK